MEIELSVDVVKPYNFVRKRQAALESFSDHEQTKKRPCLEASSWYTENTSNLETENRSLCCSQSAAEESDCDLYKQPTLTDPNSTTLNVLLDVNCNIVNQANNFEEMEVSYESENIGQSQAQLHQSSSSLPVMTAIRSSLPTCTRCLTGESGHINHLSSLH